MKIAFMASLSEESQKIKAYLQQVLQEKGFTLNSEEPELVISIGGDGTLLHAFHQYKSRVDQVKFVAIHTGHLGFYTDFLNREIDKFVKMLKKYDGKEYSYPLLQVVCELTDGKKIESLALNEVVFKTLSGTLSCEVYIGDNLFEVFRGDGLCVATPTGSTGLSKSLGGAIVHPHVDAMQLVEIAAVNNRVYKTVGSPLILPKSDEITLSLKVAAAPYLTVDNLDPIFMELNQIDKITFKLATHRIRFADFDEVGFWNRVEQSFIGEINTNKMRFEKAKRRYKKVRLEK